jgi:NTE family protein
MLEVEASLQKVQGLMERKRVGLAMSGAVARGVAHVGVLAVLEEAGIPVDFVAGTSAGAVTGAFYCAGFDLAWLCEKARSTRWWHFIRPAWPRRGLFSFRRMELYINELMGDVRQFDDLEIPFAAIATDILSGEPVAIRTGSVARAVRASASVPGIIEPVEIDGRWLCDGAISDNMPVRVLRAMGADYVIGVDLFQPNPGWGFGPLGAGFFAFENFVRRAGGGILEADILISPDMAGRTYLQFSKADELLDLGMAAARAAVPAIQALLAAPGGDVERAPGTGGLTPG